MIKYINKSYIYIVTYIGFGPALFPEKSEEGRKVDRRSAEGRYKGEVAQERDRR